MGDAYIAGLRGVFIGAEKTTSPNDLRLNSVFIRVWHGCKGVEALRFDQRQGPCSTVPLWNRSGK